MKTPSSRFSINLTEREQVMIGEISVAHDVNFRQAIKIALKAESERLKTKEGSKS